MPEVFCNALDHVDVGPPARRHDADLPWLLLRGAKAAGRSASGVATMSQWRVAFLIHSVVVCATAGMFVCERSTVLACLTVVTASFANVVLAQLAYGSPKAREGCRT